jgi:hypothetical protein
VLNASTPLSLINASICPLHFSIAISFIVFIFTLVDITTGPSEDTIALFLVLTIIAFVLVTLGTFLALPAAFAVLQAALKLADVERTVLPSVLPFPVRLTFLVLPNVYVTIGEDVSALTML